MKGRHAKTLKEKYSIKCCNNDKLYGAKEDAEILFNLYDYLGYLYIPKTIYEISAHLNESDDRNCVQNHLDNLYKTKVVKVTDKITEVIFVNYHLNELSFCNIENSKYIVKGNVLEKKELI